MMQLKDGGVMNKASLQQLQTALEQLSTLRSSVGEGLARPAADGTRFDLDAIVPGTEASASELDIVLAFILDATKSIGDTKIALLLPKTQMNTLATQLQQINVQLTAIANYIGPSQTVRTINAPAQYTFSNAANQQLNLSGHFQNIANHLESALTSWHLLRSIAGAPKYKDLSEALKLIGERRVAIDTEFAEVKAHAKKLAEASADAAATAATIRERQDEMIRLVELVDKDRTTIAERSVETAQKTETIRALTAEATKIGDSARAYEGMFSEFQNLLDQRNDQFKIGTKNISDLQRQLAERLGAVDELKTQADAMLVGATNVGLASAFSKRAVELRGDVSKARRAYYFSIAFLVLLSLPLAFFLIPKELLGPLLRTMSIPATGTVPNVSSAATGSDLLAQVLARALLLVPGWFLVRFCAARHERSFKLLEHYEYKYSIAAAVEGFKKQAPGYESEIAAASFFELTDNPATSLDAKGPETRHPNRMMEAVLKRLEGKGESKIEPEASTSNSNVSALSVRTK
jgi:hypothetical protein